MFKARCLLVVCSLIVLVKAAPIDKDSDAKILSNVYTIDEKGNYKFSFKTSNGITREETGSVFNAGEPNAYIFVIGSYSYFDTKGQKQIVEYIASDNGYNISPQKPYGEMAEFGLPGSVVATLLGKMQCLLLLCFIVLMTNAAPLKNSTVEESDAQILSNEYIIYEDGNYRFSFKTSNGITRSETGAIINKGQPNEHVEVKGQYTYFDTDGKEELVLYIADENGYRLRMPEKSLPGKKKTNNRLLSSAVASLLG
ncbi:uncharacterized protein LOC123866748 [Maniola jurtina]|uniref:uncharacterized protein LOC123866748 n=1 Tax=Maniola jurtina TaxID=191418 RepID=UPI001E68891A|nr:uncharacterized protein LOC123866748 [Maniola jurtina]